MREVLRHRPAAARGLAERIFFRLLLTVEDHSQEVVILDVLDVVCVLHSFLSK